MSTTWQSAPEILCQEAEARLARGEIEEAELRLSDALSRAPNDHRALALMAEARLRSNKLADAFELLTRAVCAAPDVERYKERFLDLAGRGLDVVHSVQLEMAVAACLRSPEHAGALENWVSLLAASPAFRAVYGFANRQPPGGADRPRLSFDLASLEPLFGPLFIEGLKNHIVCDPVFEAFLTQVRSKLLDTFCMGKGRFPKQDYLVLAVAVSHYAFLTDFILEETEPEKQCIAELRRRIETDADPAAIAAAVAIFACYRPLCDLANADEVLRAFQSVETLSGVVKAQIADPVSLRQRASSIPTLTRASHETSQRVREQYEQFPYPRWKTLSKRRVVQDWQSEEFSRRLEGPLSDRPAKILIAGCGTGRDAAIHAVRFPRASITAVDISRASLAYASFKASELGLRNLAFLHADILDLGAIGETFDLVCCTGVLHHMEDPLAGWRALRGLLRPGGLMRIGLYSRIGRTAVATAQDVARREEYPATREGILRFRQDCPSLCDRETMLGLSRLQDYYQTNMYRDLLFPARERRFDLFQIKDMLRALGLTFEGFHVPPDVLTMYRAIFRDDRDETNLDCWQNFEERYPETFASMYIFWCRKPRDL